MDFWFKAVFPTKTKKTKTELQSVGGHRKLWSKMDDNNIEKYIIIYIIINIIDRYYR